MEHWSVEDYKNFANNKVKKVNIEQIKLLLMVILLIAKKKLIIIVN